MRLIDRHSSPMPVEDKQVMEEQRRGLGKGKSADIKPGKGWEVVGEPQGYCDGSYYAVCRRDTDNQCVLGGHHDGRGALIGNAFSGWLVFNVPAVKEGIIMIKVHSWSKSEENTITADWNSENNERRMLGLDGDEYEDHERRLDTDPAEVYPDTFKMEYAINGKVTTLSKKEYMEKRHRVQRVVEVLTLLDDPNFTKEETDVEVAIRLQDCGKDCAIGVSHLYWA